MSALIRRPAQLAVTLVLAFAAAVPASAQAAGPPQITAVWTTEVVATSARLNAEINPEGATTTYHFNYIPQAAYEANLSAGDEGFLGAVKAPTGADRLVGSGIASVPIARPIAALSPETTYRYRVVATNTVTQASPAYSFTTESFGGSSLLLDDRGWEMVSPVEKGGGSIQGPGGNYGGDVLQAAAGGESVTYSSNTSFGEGALGAPWASQYVSRRTPGGWVTENITPPTLSSSYGEHPDGVPYQLFSSDLSRAVLLDGRRCGAGEECSRSYSLRSGDGAFLADSPQAQGLRLAGATPDLSHLVLQTCAALIAEAVEEPEGAGCDAADTNLYEWSGGALTLIDASEGEILPAPFGRLAAQADAISADGKRVYWRQLEDGPIWLHEEGEPARALPYTAGGAGAFQAASANGAYAFYTSAGDLYRYGARAQASEQIATGIKGVLGASESGSVLYYQASDGLFRWQEGGPPSEIVTGAEAASPSDYPPATGTARVTADGSALAFLSTERLTGYDNTDQTTGRPDEEVYLYEAGSGGGGTLTCVSCNPTDERPLGPSTIPGAVANGTGPEATDSYKPRVLSTDGKRLFFDSEDSLVLTDTDDAPDVYEWEAFGEGTCRRSGGCLALISSGHAEGGATFIDASADGSDAFFLTEGSLVPQDPGSSDLYDAREGGGFPVSATPLECEGDACQSLPSEPEDPEPGTLHPGPYSNPPPRYPPLPCPDGKRRVHRHGKEACVAKKRHVRHERNKGKHKHRAKHNRKGTVNP